MEVIIRTMEQIDAMGETGEALKTIAKHNLFKPRYPLIYQFKKGVPGESMTHDEKDVIGSVSNVKITSEGLVGDVNVTVVAANAVHFDGMVDNFVISKTLGKSVPYDLKHFVVYNKKAKEYASKEREYKSNTVKKFYNAPTEVLDANPETGDVLAKNIKSWNQTLQEVIDDHTKNGR